MKLTIELEGLSNSSRENINKITEEIENLSKMALSLGEEIDIKVSIVSD